MTESDHELLMWAAKAAGYKVKWVDGATPFNYTGFLKEDPHLTHYNDIPVQVHWNPLKDSGQALELAVKLRLHISQQLSYVAVMRPHGGPGSHLLSWTEQYKDDPLAATRRAIVCAAAEIGENMK